jgi:glycosyltransferase involved in cell wall biosynthesis
MNQKPRVNALLLGGPFPADPTHLYPLSNKVDLTIYGSLKGLGHETFSPKPPNVGRVRTFKPIIRFKDKSILWFYPKLAATLTSDAPDVLHVVSEPWGLLAVQAARWARRHPGTALVLHGCDQLWWHGSALEQRIRKKLAHYTLERTDAFAAENGPAIAKALENGLEPDAATAQIHTNARSPELFRPAIDKAEKAAARQSLDLPKQGTGIGFVGKLVVGKGPIVLLEAFEQATSRLMPDTWIAFAGEGPLRDQLEKLGRNTRVHFLGGLSYPEQVSDLLRSIDIFVLPSYDAPGWREQGPRVVIEAMLSGCAVIGSDSGAIPEMMNGSGLVVPQKEVAPLADALVEAEKLVPEDIGRGARDLAMSKYSSQAVADQMLALWEKAVAIRSARN